MPTKDPAHHLPAGTLVKEDLSALYRLADDTVTRITHVADLLQAVMAAVAGLKEGSALTASNITTLRGLAAGLNQDVSSLQSNVREVDDFSRASVQAQGEILASAVETLLEIYDSVQTVQAALVGLKTAVQEQGSCPWKDLSADSLFSAIEILGDLAPRIKLVVEDRLTRTGRDSDTGKRHWWGRVFADRAREAVVTAFFAVLAGGLLGLFARAQFLESRPSAAALETTKTLQRKVEELEAQHQQDSQELQRLKDLESSPRRPSRRP